MQPAISSGVGTRLPGGAAFDDVADEYLLARVAHGIDHLGQQLAGAADERESLFVLVGAGAFADEHHVGLECTLAGDDVEARGGEGAGLAGRDFGGDGFESVFAALGGLGGDARDGRRRDGSGLGGGRGRNVKGRGGFRRRRRRGFLREGFAGGGNVGEALFLEVLQVFEGLGAEGFLHGGGL